MKKLHIVIATGNQNKVREYKELFEGYPFEITSLKDEGINVDIDENGTSFKENAYIKASTIAKYTSKIVIADDSGLSIHALDNFPGIRSARFMEGSSYEEKNKVIIEKLQPFLDKSAHFTCAIAVCNYPNQQDQIFEGICLGNIVEPISSLHGFGYDPIFQPVGYDETFGMMEDAKKNMISHRGRASKQLLEFIEKTMND